MEIRLNSMKLTNFKGMNSFVLEPNSKNVIIYGDNGSGKTTLKDAFNWVLFNKDSLGRTKFNIQPLDRNGNVIHNLTTKVEASLIVDGKEMLFAKEFKEKWTRKRGSGSDTLTGTETDYYVNGIPKKKSEYEKEISSLIDEDKFKLITDPFQFNERLEMKDRRKMLIDICGDISDEEILSSNAEFKPLENALNGRTVDDFRIILQSKMKPINQELNNIPIKIDEAQRAIPKDVDLSVSYADKQIIIDLISKKEEERAAIVHGSEITNLENQIKLLQRDFTSLGAIDLKGTDEYIAKEKASDDVRELSKNIDDINYKLSLKNSLLSDNKSKRNALSQKWDRVFNDNFKNDGICVTCGQPIPEEKIEEARNKFNEEKANALDAIETELSKLKTDKANIENEINASSKARDEYLKKIEDANTLYSKCVELLNEKEAKLKSEVDEKRNDILKQINELNSKIESIKENSKEIVNKIEDEISSLKSERDDIDVKIANKTFIEKQNQRINELEVQEQELSKEYSKLDSLLYLTDQFIKAKVGMLTDKINSSFKYATFKLFEVQLNEGVKETCEVMYNGVPYKDLNNAGRINIGLDIINTICNKYDISAPIFADNMESVNNAFETVSQMISLKVSKDKELKIESC